MADMQQEIEDQATCPYCHGASTPLPLDTFATDSELLIVEAIIEGVEDDDPILWVNADGAAIYVKITHCPECGRQLI